MIKLMSKITVAVCLIAIFLSGSILAASAAGRGRFVPIGPSIWMGEYTYIDINRHPVRVVAIKVDPRKYRFSIKDVVNTITRSRRIRYPSYSIGELIKITNPFLMINGSFFSSYSLPRPTGFLVINGRILHQADTRSSALNGLFYMERKTSLPHIAKFRIKASKMDSRQRKSMMPSNTYSKNYYMALQSGPLLMYRSKIIYTAVKNKFYRRSAIALGNDGKNQLRVIFVVSKDKTSLHGLVRFLSAPPQRGGLGCASALNLGGGLTSGLIMNARNHRRLRIRGSIFRIGNTDSANATVIAVSVK
ncbi:MAG: phosphodiester glycosidase family protein [Deltaproteobacteria bacterium]|nr:phosphodiester glycosidase family protein [Deltaproteobacteria bacterium]